MKIIIDIDEDVWMNAWMDWDDALPEEKRYPKSTGNLATFTKLVRKRVLDAVGMPHELCRFIEDSSVLDDDIEDLDEGDE